MSDSTVEGFSIGEIRGLSLSRPQELHDIVLFGSHFCLYRYNIAVGNVLFISNFRQVGAFSIDPSQYLNGVTV
jgi:hypothetical protein